MVRKSNEQYHGGQKESITVPEAASLCWWLVKVSILGGLVKKDGSWGSGNCQIGWLKSLEEVLMNVSFYLILWVAHGKLL